MHKRKQEFAANERNLKKRRVQPIPRLLKGTPEIKYFDDRGIINTSLTWTFTHLTNMVQGTSGINRIGAKIRIISIDIRIVFVLPTQTGTVNPIDGDLARVCIIQDAQANGNPVSGLDVFSANTMTEFQYYLTSSRFTRLVDKMSQPASSSIWITGIGSSVEFTPLNLHYSYKPITVEFIGNTAAASQVGKNAIWMAIACASGAFNADYTSRIRFVDY